MMGLNNLYNRSEERENHQATSSSSHRGDDVFNDFTTPMNDLCLGSSGLSKERISTSGSRSGDEKPTKFNPWAFGIRPVSEMYFDSRSPRPSGPRTTPFIGQNQNPVQIDGHIPFIMPPRPGGPKKVSTVGLIKAHIQKNDYSSFNMPPRPGGPKTNSVVGQKKAPVQIDGHIPFIMPPRPGGPKKFSTIGQNHSQGVEERKDPDVKSNPKETRSHLDLAQSWDRGQDPRDKPASRSIYHDEEAAHGNNVEAEIRSTSRKGENSSRTSSSSDRIGKVDATPSRRYWPMSTDP